LLNGRLKFISSGKQTVWGINYGDDIYYMKNSQTKEWGKTDGKLKQISASPGIETSTMLIV
jgi:hypothetical protein